MRKLMILSFILIGLSSCAKSMSVDLNKAYQPKNNNSIVFMSSVIRGITWGRASVELYLRKPGQKEEIKMSSITICMPRRIGKEPEISFGGLIQHGNDIDKESECGDVFAGEFEPGDYEITRITIMNYQEKTVDAVHLQPDTYVLHIKPNSVYYLGRFWFQVYGALFRGKYTELRLGIEDHFNEDVSVLKRNFHPSESMEIVKNSKFPLGQLYKWELRMFSEDIFEPINESPPTM